MRTERTEILVIGSGIAGLTFALRCAGFARVTVITKSTIGESNTMYAQGGIAGVFDDADSVENHVHDTLIAGDGLCNEEAVRFIVSEAPQCILELSQLQVPFDKTGDGHFDLHREGGHSHARVVHTADATGRAVETTLVKQVKAHPEIALLENHFALDLLVENNICYGATAVDTRTGETICFEAPITMLATGGGCQVYRENTNPAVATGDGIAMAYRAGADIENMEFVQFHPTTLYAPGKGTFLITEALRGFGAELKHADGSTFMEHYHEMKSLAPRDIVTRAITAELKKKGTDCVYLDVRGFEETEIKKHFPTIYERCAQEGIDVTKEMIPVVPAAHYMCGGVATDLEARTSIQNLFACGEVTCTGVHGANRLASNSLLEGIAFARKAASLIETLLPSLTATEIQAGVPEIIRANDSFAAGMREALRELLWLQAGILRNGTDLQNCLEQLMAWEQQLSRLQIKSVQTCEVLNMVQTGLLITRSALERHESRGCHYRTDYPTKDNELHNTVISVKNTLYV